MPSCCFVWYSPPFWKSAMYSLFLGACIYILKYEISFDWVCPAHEPNTRCCLRLLFSNSSSFRFCVVFKCCNFWCLLLHYSLKLWIVRSLWSFSIVVSLWWFVGCGFFSVSSYFWSSVQLPVIYLENALYCTILFFYISVSDVTKSKT